MLHAALRDLAHRKRRYLISMVGCGLVFGMSFVMTGLTDSFPLEWRKTVGTIGAAAFYVPEGVTGPFTGANPFGQGELPAGTEPLTYGVQMASATVDGEPDVRATGLFGVEPGGPLEPAVVGGRQLAADGEVLVSDRAPYRLGSTVRIGGLDLRVVGVVSDLSVNGGMPGTVVSFADAQDIVFGGLPLTSAAAVPIGADPPDAEAVARSGLSPVAPDEAAADAVRLLAGAQRSVNLMKVLLWAVAALIVGSVLYLSVIERLRDFAVFKTIGTATSAIAGGVVLQSTVLAVGSALIGILIGLVLAPVFPVPVELSVRAALGLPLLGLVVGIVASLFGLSRVLRVEPALAFGGGM